MSIDPATMTDRQKVFAILQGLNLPLSQYVVAGSAAMVLRGIDIDRPLQNIDLFVSTALWHKLYETVESGIVWGVGLPEAEDPEQATLLPYLFFEGLLDITVIVRYAADAHYLLNGDTDILRRAIPVETDDEKVYAVVDLSDLAAAKEDVGGIQDLEDVMRIGEFLGVGEDEPA